MTYSELTNIELARRLMRVVWQIYDHNGISMGRSRDSVLLELAMSLMSLPYKEDDTVFISEYLVTEAKKRVYFGKMEDIVIRADLFDFSKQHLFDFGSFGLSDNELALYILIGLKKEMLDEVSDIVLRNFYLAFLIKTICMLIFSETRTFFEKSFSTEEALQEARNRRFRRINDLIVDLPIS